MFKSTIWMNLNMQKNCELSEVDIYFNEFISR